MDRVTTNLDFVADALQLIASPACACDADGIYLPPMRTARPARRDRRRLAPGRPVRAVALEVGAAQVHAAQFAEQRWESALRADGDEVAVQVRPSRCRRRRRRHLRIHRYPPFRRRPAALRTTLLEQKAILENAAVGIMLSKDRVIRECNIRAAEMFGYGEHELIGMSSVCIFPSVQATNEMGKGRPTLAIGRGLHQRNRIAAQGRPPAVVPPVRARGRSARQPSTARSGSSKTSTSRITTRTSCAAPCWKCRRSWTTRRWRCLSAR